MGDEQTDGWMGGCDGWTDGMISIMVTLEDNY